MAWVVDHVPNGSVHIEEDGLRQQRSDVLVIHDDDGFTNEVLLHALECNNVSYLSLENDSKPGISKLENFNKLLSKSDKVVFVVSEELCRNEFTRFMVENVIQLPKDKILTLVTTGSLNQNGIFPLESTAVFYKDKDPINELIAEIKRDTRAPDFCAIVAMSNTSSILFLHGLCLQHFCADTYGLMIALRDRYLKVNLDEFSKHIDAHDKLKTDKICGQCSYIRGLDTKVSLVINKDFRTVSCTENVLSMFARLCGEVCDGSAIRTNWMVILSCEGPFDENQQNIVSALNRQVFKMVSNETNRRVLELIPCFPKFCDLEMRVNSFPDDWPGDDLPPARAMAEAGFYFVSRPCRLQCYNCGLNISAVQKEDNPLNLHLRNTVCPYLKIEPTKNKEEKMSSYQYPIKTYMTLSTRLDTFHDFIHKAEKELTDPPNSTEEAEDVVRTLAEAGFYYLGIGTLVTCYMCGLKLTYRDLSVDPWFAHAELSSNCIHLRDSHYDFRAIKPIKKRMAYKPTIIIFQLYVENQRRNEEYQFFSFSKQLDEEE